MICDWNGVFFFYSYLTKSVVQTSYTNALQMYTDRGDEIGFMYSRFAITRVIVLESSYLFLTEGMYTSGYITVNVTKRLEN
jgi:hypothetical protein